MERGIPARIDAMGLYNALVTRYLDSRHPGATSGMDMLIAAAELAYGLTPEAAEEQVAEDLTDLMENRG